MDPRDAATVPERGEADDAPAMLGRFVLEHRLGEGGMGIVYQARDPMLGRAVAVKVLRGDGGVVDQARLLREAQSLAQLSHPNVVTVFEVGVVDDRVFVAMELVVGATLRQWLDAPRGWRAIVDMFVGVGRGVAAVHALDLVHRDVKPSNVLIDAGGAPKLGDFGLVCRVGEATAEVMGTPSYMAPEQKDGAAADPRIDQYAFAVALREALGDRAPSRVRAILARAAADDPDARYPSMTPLLAELARARRGAARWWLAAGAVTAVAGAVALTWALGRSPPAADPCPTPPSPAWTDARRAEVRAAIAALDPQAAQVDVVARVVDPYVADWAAMRASACKANRVDGRESDTLHDQRVRCLDRRDGELAASLRMVTAAHDRDALDGAVRGLQHLSPIAECGDPAALARADALPLDPDARAEAVELAQRAADLEVEVRAGRLDGATERGEALVADARRLDHAPTLTTALRLQAAIQTAIYDNAGAATTMRELTQVAAKAHDDHAEALAWISLIEYLGYEEGKPDEALAMVPAASAAVLRSGDPPDLRAALLYAQAQVLDVGPRVDEALVMLEDARKRLAELSPRFDGPLADIVFEMGAALATKRDFAGSIARYRESIAMTRTLYGPDTVDEAISLYNLATTQQRQGALKDAIATFRETIRIVELRLGDSPQLAEDLCGLSSALGDDDQWAESLAGYDRAYAMAKDHLEPGDRLSTFMQTGRALALTHLGRDDDALAAYATLLAGIDPTHVQDPNVSLARHHRGQIYARLDRCAEAVADFRAAVAEYEVQGGASNQAMLDPLLGEGRCLVLADHAAEAIAPLTRAVALEADPREALDHVLAQAWLGRALVTSRGDRARGLALARTARAALVALPDDPEAVAELATLDRWLASR